MCIHGFNTYPNKGHSLIRVSSAMSFFCLQWDPKVKAPEQWYEKSQHFIGEQSTANDLFWVPQWGPGRLQLDLLVKKVPCPRKRKPLRFLAFLTSSKQEIPCSLFGRASGFAPCPVRTSNKLPCPPEGQAASHLALPISSLAASHLAFLFLLWRLRTFERERLFPLREGSDNIIHRLIHQ